MNLLRRLLHGTVCLEASHELLHTRQGVGEGAITQFSDGLLDPLKEVGDHLVILILHAFYVHHDSNDLKERYVYVLI